MTKGQKGAASGRTLWQETLIRFRSNRLAVAGFLFILVLVAVSVGTLIIDKLDNNTIYTHYVINQNLVNRLAPPSAEHIFGCDEFGRDLLFRMIWGTRYSLFIGITAILVATLFGGIIGAIAGYYGGKIDNTIMRVMDVFLAIPSMVLAIALVAALGTSLFNLLLSIAIPQIPRLTRVVRAAVMSVRDKEFIESAKAVGAGDFRVITQYIIPNAMAPVIVQATVSSASAILSIASLSYLGLGVEPPIPEWGSILMSAKTYMRDAWHLSIIPGLSIMVTVLSLNLFGDGLRDALDPKLKK